MSKTIKEKMIDIYKNFTYDKYIEFIKNSEDPHGDIIKSFLQSGEIDSHELNDFSNRNTFIFQLYEDDLEKLEIEYNEIRSEEKFNALTKMLLNTLEKCT